MIGFINIYKQKDRITGKDTYSGNTIYPTRENADRNAVSDRIDCCQIEFNDKGDTDATD
jgi:hypothetical protein